MKSVISLFLLLILAGAAFAKDLKSEIKVSGLTCGACAVSVKSALTRVKGVKSADISYEKGVAAVVYDDQQTNEQQLREAISRTGFKAEPNEVLSCRDDWRERWKGVQASLPGSLSRLPTNRD